jgi:hypothetical protein
MHFTQYDLDRPWSVAELSTLSEREFTALKFRRECKNARFFVPQALVFYALVEAGLLGFVGSVLGWIAFGQFGLFSLNAVFALVLRGVVTVFRPNPWKFVQLAILLVESALYTCLAAVFWQRLREPVTYRFDFSVSNIMSTVLAIVGFIVLAFMARLLFVGVTVMERIFTAGFERLFALFRRPMPGPEPRTFDCPNCAAPLTHYHRNMEKDGAVGTDLYRCSRCTSSHLRGEARPAHTIPSARGVTGSSES